MKKIFLLFFMVSALIGCLTAQKIEATVEVTYSHLSQEAQNELQDLKSSITEYINGYEWSQDRLEVFIPLKISIIVESQSLSAGTPQYQAQFLIASPSGENYYERKWLFQYARNEVLTHDRIEYHQIANLMDYYIYLIMAGEADTYELLGGTEFYDKARNVLSQGMSSDAGSWSGRERDFNEMMNADHTALREAKFYYYQSLFLIELAGAIDTQQIREYNKLTCDKLYEVFRRRPNSKHIKRFMDAHYQEFCTLLQYDESDDNLIILKEVDPLHKKDYENCLE